MNILKRQAADVTLIEDHKRHAQQELYRKYFGKYIRNSGAGWLVIVDLDEFLYAKSDEGLANLLSTLPEQVGSVSIPWKMFGSAGHVAHPTGRVVDNFLLRQKYDDNHQVNVKSVYRINAIRMQDIDPHTSGIEEGFVYVDDAFRPIKRDNLMQTSERKLREALLALNHYPIQSEEFFRDVKIPRGDVHCAAGEGIRDMAYFKSYDKNDVTDGELSAKSSRTTRNE